MDIAFTGFFFLNMEGEGEVGLIAIGEGIDEGIIRASSSSPVSRRLKLLPNNPLSEIQFALFRLLR